MKIKMLMSAALIAGVISARATSGAVSPMTNSTSDAVKALFGDPVVVKAKSFSIKRSEIDELFSTMKARAAEQGQIVPPEGELLIMNQLVTIQLLLQKATDADRAAGKASSDAQFEKVLKSFPSPEAFARQLKAANTTEAELRAKATQEATATAALKRELGINITDDAAKEYYAANPAKFEEPEKVHVQHILLFTVDPTSRPLAPLPTNTVAAKRKLADDIQKRAAAGEDFAKLAQQYSEDPGSKDKGGDIPEFIRDNPTIAPEFVAAAFALPKDKVSDVITVSYGLHIVKSLGKIAARKVPYSECAAELKDGLAGMKLREAAPDYIKKLRTDNDVQVVDERLKALEDKAREAAAAQPTMQSPAGK